MAADQLNWDDLKIFLAVARTGNLVKAARKLRIDQSTVSRRITQLEYALGASLFERSHTGLALNGFGAELLESVQSMDTGFAALSATLDRQSSVLHGPVRIGTMEGIATLYLSSRLAAFHREYPAITVELVTSAQQLYVTHREADVFLGFFKPQGRGLDAEQMGRFSLHLYASDSYLEQQGVPEDVDALSQHKFVGYIDDLIQIDAVRWLEEVVSKPDLVFQSTSMLAQMFAAAAGVGIVLLPDFADAGRFGLRRVLGDEVRVTRDLWLSVHRELRYVPRIKAAVSFLENLLLKDPLFAQTD
ncbi:HTH-type transcriptional regulator HdfR [Pseudomonas fluorescens]|uniref:HTH-type transcriptional regulator HdfR n=1 Tax=Pseudomonas fluorescens TaxID=294 RepID=A0A8H2NU02_PSEFL|nr:LysR family transcriptional regulator [Pseudomonas fluorescens]VVP15729.1 HTH-type transcriptional regulator HdfR [Pseudomonas fluorescens]